MPPAASSVRMFVRTTEVRLSEPASPRTLVDRMSPPAVVITVAPIGFSIVPLIQIAEDGGWMGIAIELLILQALALQGQNKTAEALDALHRALLLAEPEGYVRTFVDEGAPMVALLREAAARGIATGYVNKLLAVSGVSEYEGVGLTDQPLIDPLSERELQVLHLIATGLSNREIAERLVVAVSTVKTHINNIYRKLDVSKRTQAVARAREMELL